MRALQLRLFQQFCGFDPLRGYGEPDFYLYLRCLARAQSKVGVLFPSDNEQDTVMNTNPNQADILLEEPALLAQFKDDKDVALDFIEQFSAANGSVEKVSNEVNHVLQWSISKFRFVSFFLFLGCCYWLPLFISLCS